MSVKVSPFNIHTIKKYGLKKLQDMELQRKQVSQPTPEPVEPEQAQTVEEVVEEVAEEVVEEVVESIDDSETAEEVEVVEAVEVADEPEAEEEVSEGSAEHVDDLSSLSEEELRSIARDLKISHWWNKSEERLIDEIRELRS